MTASPDHGKLAPTLQGIHVSYQWVYADAAARAAASGFVSTDVGKLALQSDTNALWLLTAITPTWVAVGSGAGGPPTGAAGGDLTGTYPNPTVNIDGKTGKTTPADGDETFLADSAASFATKKLSWSNIKATLKTYFDTLYSTLALGSTATSSAVGDAASGGSASTASKSDHTHGREAFGAVTAQTTYGASSANGVATTEARADHAHGTVGHDDHANLTNVTANQHHAQLHESTHASGGSDPFTSSDDLVVRSLTGHTRIGASGAAATSAALDVVSTDGAILIPRMTTTQRNALTAAAGMIIYNTSTGTFQKYDGAWADFGTSGVSPLTIKEVDGTPSVAGVTVLQVTNGTLTDNGSGNVTLTIAAGASYNDPAEGLAMALSL